MIIYLLLSVIFLDLILAVIIYGLLESISIQVRTIKIHNDKIPKSFWGKKLVFLADIHHGAMLSDLRFKKIKEKVDQIKPDILLFGGDYVISNEKYIKPIFEKLKTLEAPLGKFGVLGNHDHSANQKLTEESMKNAEIQNLDNNSVWVNIGEDRIKIGGVGDLWNDSQNVEATLFDATEDDFVILLSHNPDFAEELKTKKIDYVVSGHVHGGQINFFGIFAPITFSEHGQKYTKGYVETDKTRVIVSRGIGVSTVPLRFFAKPEIVLLEL